MSRATAIRAPFDHRGIVKAAIAAVVLASLTAGGILAALPAAATATPQNVEVLALSENFEGVLGARGWEINDKNPVNGPDFWATSNARAADGNYSGWAAGAGDRFTVINIWESDFENGSTAGWTFADRNNTDSAGVDTWGIDSYRAHNGTKSLWCAEVGNNFAGSSNAMTNVQRRQYDTYQNSTATVATNLAGYQNVQLEYWYWTNNEVGWDGLYVAWFDGAWHFENPKNGASGTWQKTSYTIPSNAQQVGFLFTSDPSVIYEGSYVDDVRLYATRVDQNRDLRLYEDNMDAQMVHDVDVGYFDSARLEYRYWSDTQANDTLEVMISDGTNWVYLDPHSGVSGGWAASSLIIPTTTKAVGFRFSSNATGRSEGVYVDEFNVYGSVLPVSCTGVVYETAGMEVVSPFHFSGTASGGLRPFTWSWNFGDGTTIGGTLPSHQNPIHAFPEVGIYTPVITVTDSLGQTCSSPTAPVTISHDLTSVFVTPATARLTEGTSVTVYGFDGQGHPYDLDWDLVFSECGVLSSPHGPTVTITAATDAGGTTCTVTGAVGSARSSMRLTVLQDTSIIHITPPAATVIEGHGLRISATDRYGGELPFLWTTTCGRVGGSASSFTLFEAVIEGGVTCSVTAAFGSNSATSLLTITHDTGLIDVTPKTATLIEGSGQSFSAVDGYGHPFEAEWSVDPADCGHFSLLTGASTTFVSSIDAGGLDCTLAVAYGTDHREVGISVQHDLRDASVTPTSASLQGGASIDFRYGDANGHAFAATWSVSPGGCGAFDPTEGPSTKLTVSGDYAGYTCTVSGTGIGFTRFASVVVEYGAPATIVVTPTSDVVEADGTVLVSVAVKDAAGHTIPSVAVNWETSTCGAVAPAVGSTTILSAPADAAGKHCTVTATYTGLSGSADVRVNHVGPFTVTVTPVGPSLSGGQTQVFSAAVVDAAGAPVPDAAVVWSTTCGRLSSTTGASVTFTAPADMATAKCEVTASSSAGGVAYQAASRVSAASSPLFLILGIAVAGGVAGLVAFRMRKGRAPAAPHTEAAPVSYDSEAAVPGEAAPAPEAAPAALACPRCASPIEVGWTACPECGTDLNPQ